MIRRLRNQGPRDRGSLTMVMLVAIVGMGLALMMTPLVLTQTHTTTFQVQRGESLRAAQSGIDDALRLIRTSGGKVSNLPCGTLSQAIPDSGTYSVTVTYFADDPRAGAATPLSDCDSWTDDDTAPRFAQISATGNDPGTSHPRTLSVTYQFATTDRETGGGIIRLWPRADGSQRCLAAGAFSPGEGVTVQPCDTGAPTQLFLYRPDRSVQLAHQDDAALDPTGEDLCLTADSSATDGALTIEICGSSPADQTWLLDSNGHLRLDDPAGPCLASPDRSTLSLAAPAACTGDWNDPAQAWIFSPDTGSGQAAGANPRSLDSSQLVTLMGRCLEAGAPVRLAPCDQSPNPTTQQWTREGDSGDAIKLRNGSQCLVNQSGSLQMGDCAASGATWAVTEESALQSTQGGQQCLVETRNDAVYNRWLIASLGDCSGASVQRWASGSSAAALADLYESRGGG